VHEGLSPFGTIQIPADELFLVMSHEIAYEIFNMLNEKKTAVYIPIIKENNPEFDFSALVSWKLSKQDGK